MTKLASSLPNGNGLNAIAPQLVDDPHRQHLVVALVDCKLTTTDNDTGEVVPTARVRRIEVIGDNTDRDMAARLMVRAYESRTGKAVLPLDIEAEITKILDGSEPSE